MEWQFTPQQVVKAEVDYGLEAFRHDLMQEISLNLPGLDAAQYRQVFALAYDLFHWLATGEDYDEFEARFEDMNTVLLLRALNQHGQANTEMLGAILQRLIMDGVESGQPLEQALNQAAARHGEICIAPQFM